MTTRSKFEKQICLDQTLWAVVIDFLAGTKQLKEQIIAENQRKRYGKLGTWEPGLSQYKKMRIQYLLFPRRGSVYSRNVVWQSIYFFDSFTALVYFRKPVLVTVEAVDSDFVISAEAGSIPFECSIAATCVDTASSNWDNDLISPPKLLLFFATSIFAYPLAVVNLPSLSPSTFTAPLQPRVYGLQRVVMG